MPASLESAPSPADVGAVSKAPSRAPAPAQPGQPARPASAPPPPADAAKAPQPTKNADARPADGSIAQLLIFTGDVQMITEAGEMASTLDHAIDVAESFGGYIGGRNDASVTVRVPSAHFREALTKIEHLGEVTHRSVTAEDVTEQFNDLEVRVSNLRATQKRLQEFLAKSGTMADMLTVQRELERVSGEIEQIEGKMRFLKSRASFSTITVGVTARPKPVAPVVAKPEPPPPPRKVEMPIDWLPGVGLDSLLNLR